MTKIERIARQFEATGMPDVAATLRASALTSRRIAASQRRTAQGQRQAAVDRRLDAMTYAERLEALTKLEVRALKMERQFGTRTATCDCLNGPVVMGGLCARCRAACVTMAVASW